MLTLPKLVFNTFFHILYILLFSIHYSFRYHVYLTNWCLVIWIMLASFFWQCKFDNCSVPKFEHQISSNFYYLKVVPAILNHFLILICNGNAKLNLQQNLHQFSCRQRAGCVKSIFCMFIAINLQRFPLPLPALFPMQWHHSLRWLTLLSISCVCYLPLGPIHPWSRYRLLHSATANTKVEGSSTLAWNIYTTPITWSPLLGCKER